MRPGAESVAKFSFLAEAIHRALNIPHDYTVYDVVEHYAFLSPFPESIKAEVGLPANDPEGFDQSAFLTEVNEAIVEYFEQNLVRK